MSLQVVHTIRDQCCYECIKCQFEAFQYTNESDREKCYNCTDEQRAVNGYVISNYLDCFNEFQEQLLSAFSIVILNCLETLKSKLLVGQNF